MKTKWIIIGLLVLIFFGFVLSIEAASDYFEKSVLPFDAQIYQDGRSASLWEILKGRVKAEPFNLVATIIFFLAVVHTLLAAQITNLAKRYEKLSENGWSYRAETLHVLGEVEVIFALWLIPLIIAIAYNFGWNAVGGYLNSVDYTEAIFVVVIMAIAATKPIIYLAETALKKVAGLGKCSPGAWWFSILTIGPLLGSFITEPAAMTISAMLLAHQFYRLKPSIKLAYATLGLLFVNVSIGGTLSHFAAPPVLMVAGTWKWDTPFMLLNFGWKAVLAILISNTLYFYFFKKDFQNMKECQKKKEYKSEDPEEGLKHVPIPIMGLHIFFLVWTVMNMHSVPLVFGGFMVFLAVTQVTKHHQFKFEIRAPLLVGLFLAGLVTHGTLQQWWIEPILGSLTEVPLFIGATILTAFNDNAAITFLASLVPAFANNVALQKAVVYGAVAGGGLTVIANAPNPAGQSLLSKFFKDGVSPKNLFLAALLPTVIVALIFMLFP